MCTVTSFTGVSAFAQDTSSPVASPPTAGVQTTLGGNAFPLLAPGTTEDVEVVAHGEYDGNIIPVLIRNNSGDTVYNIEAKVEVRDASGSLIGVGESSSSHALKPGILNPGEYAIGWVFLDADVPADAEMTFKALFETEPDFMSDFSINLHFGEINWLQDKIVGEVVNPKDTAVRNVWLNALCIGPNGELLSAEIHNLDETIPAEGVSAFQMNGGVFGDLTTCENFVISGTANVDD